MSKLIEKIQARITDCSKNNKPFERDTLKTVLGEIQTIQSRTGKMDDDGVMTKELKEGVAKC